MHVNGGMSRFVFSLFFYEIKKKIFSIKIVSCPGNNKANLLISTIRQRQDQKRARIWALCIVVDSIMIAVLSRERARNVLTFAAAALHDSVMQDRCNYDYRRILLHSALALPSELERRFVEVKEDRRILLCFLFAE